MGLGYHIGLIGDILLLLGGAVPILLVRSSLDSSFIGVGGIQLSHSRP